MRLLKEARDSQDVLAVAAKFECDFCQKRGHANMHAPSAVIRNHDAWECMSVDTFWWHNPHKNRQGDFSELLSRSVFWTKGVISMLLSS